LAASFSEPLSLPQQAFRAAVVGPPFTAGYTSVQIGLKDGGGIAESSSRMPVFIEAKI
jgi:hypothetical protein